MRVPCSPGQPGAYLRSFLVPLLQQLNCSVITYNAAAGTTTAAAESGFQPHSHKELSWPCAATMPPWVYIDPTGEKALLIDERGRSIQGDLYTALLSLLVFREHRGSTVAVPVNTTHVVERLAERYQGKVLRTKAAPRSLMEAELQDPRRHELPMSLEFDGIAALIYLLDLLATQDLTLGALLEEIPTIKIREREIPCPWNYKGRVMRRLIQETARDRTEMIDGLKIFHPQGWALIMPDPDKPSYHVYCEGYSEEISESLSDFYVDKINMLKQES